MKTEPFINKIALFEVLLSITPGMFAAIITHNNIWLLASFFSVSSIMPYQRCYAKPSTSILHLVFTSFISLIASHYTHDPVVFTIFLVILGLILAYVDLHNPELQIGVRWIFISIIYSSFHLSEEKFINIELFIVILLGIFGVVLATKVAQKTLTGYKFIYHKEPYAFIYYFKYALPLLISSLVFFTFNLKQGQWLIWSSLSVVYLELELSKKRAEDRIKSLSIGVLCGIILTPILPHYFLMQFLYLTAIFLSLRIFNQAKNYRLSFGIRCCFIMLYANHNFMEVGKYRVLNIVVGAIIGFSTSYMITKIAKNSEIYKK